MFTGIVEETGKVLHSRPLSEGLQLMVACQRVPEDLHPGDSICVSGCCLTATEVSRESFTAELSNETLERTYFRGLKRNALVNLERSLQLQSRLGGHLVSGHVDATGQVIERPLGTGVGKWAFSFPDSLECYIVEKGSIAVDGISLTIARCSSDTIQVAIIPTTVLETNLTKKQIGDPVNLEVDLLAKYVEKLLMKKSSTPMKRALSRVLEDYDYL